MVDTCHYADGEEHRQHTSSSFSLPAMGKFKYLPSLPETHGHLPFLVCQLYIYHLNSRQCYIFTILDDVASQLIVPACIDRGK
jgi:hypothetical protein